ncbi:hypothetical protein [Hyphomicrobium sp.]|uniref:hypothetical protein n=1 Tax=Hyphomicrobium sp. TaxID=82 RepID=UPI002FE16FDB
MIKISPLTLLSLTVLAFPARAEPPADIDACIALSSETTRAANIKTETDYVKFHSMLLNLDSACGARDFAEAEKISHEIKAAFPPNK